MKNDKFSSMESGLFNSSELNKAQLRAVTGGQTTFKTVGGGSGTDTINTDNSTSFSDGTSSGKNTDGSLKS